MNSDFLIIGGGIAGASIGYWLAAQGSVNLLEREPQPGYHTTGRSAALFMASYGTPQVRALTLASRSFLDQPPPGFAESPILCPRGAMMVATIEQAGLLEDTWRIFESTSPLAQRLNRQQTLAMVPVLRAEHVLGAAHEPDASDIDVHALHQGYLKGLRRQGGQVHTDAGVIGIERSGKGWLVHTAGQSFHATVLINAAGAWCDAVAQLAGVQPIGLVPKRRSAFIFAPPTGLRVHDWPCVASVDESWYIKPDAGLLLGSPANADPTHPQDVQPEELDIAIGIDRIETMTTLQVNRPMRTWAGLRSFVADGDLVGGFDAAAAGFFWLAAQGGYGIQTSAAMGQACAALASGRPIPPHIADFGLTAAMLSPARAGLLRTALST